MIGAGWGAYVLARPEINREIGAAIARMIDDGFVRPIVGERFALEQAADALQRDRRASRDRQGRARRPPRLSRRPPRLDSPRPSDNAGGGG